MPSDFASARAKLQRAKEHIDELQRKITTFVETEPYKVVAHDNPEDGTVTFVVEGRTEPLPDEIPLLIGDAAHNLRSALDHIAYSAVPLPHPPGQDVAFPFRRKGPRPTPKEWKGTVKGKLKGANPRLIRAIEGLEVYQGGNAEWLWSLDHLDIVDKHRLLLAVAIAHTREWFDMYGFLKSSHPEEAWVQELSPMWVGFKLTNPTRVEPGAELGRIPSQHQAHTKFTFDITFGEPATLTNEPAVPTLRRLADETEGLLNVLIPLA